MLRVYRTYHPASPNRCGRKIEAGIWGDYNDSFAKLCDRIETVAFNEQVLLQMTKHHLILIRTDRTLMKIQKKKKKSAKMIEQEGEFWKKTTYVKSLSKFSVTLAAIHREYNNRSSFEWPLSEKRAHVVLDDHSV